MLDNLVKTYDTCIAYYKKSGNSRKVKELEKKRRLAKKSSLYTEDE